MDFSLTGKTRLLPVNALKLGEASSSLASLYLMGLYLVSTGLCTAYWRIGQCERPLRTGGSWSKMQIKINANDDNFAQARLAA